MSNPITEKQRSYIYRLLKDGSFSTFRMQQLRNDDSDIPHVHDYGEWDTQVWEWIGMLDIEQASSVIKYLQEHQ